MNFISAKFKKCVGKGQGKRDSAEGSANSLPGHQEERAPSDATTNSQRARRPSQCGQTGTSGTQGSSGLCRQSQRSVKRIKYRKFKNC